MKSRTVVTWWALILGASFLAGCARDPQVAKRKHLDRGDSYFQAGKYREAAIEYQNALQIDPRFAQAHYELAQCHLKLANWQQAYQELMRTVSLQPENSKAQLNLGSLFLAGGRFLDARFRAETVLKDDQRNPEALVLLSRADAGLNDLTKALSEAQKAAEMDPNRAASYMNVAWIEEKKQDLPAAERDLQKAISTDPKFLAAMIALGNLYERQKRWTEAEREFQAAIGLEPQNIMPRAGLAGLYLMQGQKSSAQQVLQESKEALKDNPAGYRMLGDFYITQGEPDKAVEEFASLHAEHPKDLLVTKTYAQLLILRNRLDEATKLNDTILKTSASDTDALILRGQIMTRQGHPSDAIHVLEKAVKDAPNNAIAHYYLGVAYAGVWNLGQAESEWLRAAQLQPRLVEPQRSLAKVALRKNDATLADRGKRLMEIEPYSPEGYVFHAEALFRRGDRAGAEADLKKAIEVAPLDSTGYVRMGDLRFGQKRFADAEKFYAQALSANPSAADALTGLVNVDLARRQLDKALRRVQDQIAHVPNSSALYALLGQVELRNKEQGRAETAFNKATELDPNNVPAFLLLAFVQASRGSVDQAIGDYQRAIQNNPRDVRLYLSLGSLLETRDQWQQAEEYYKKALEIQPDYPAAANDLAYLMLEHGENINVAFSLAETARRGLPELPNTADTLGWAYYHQGVYNAAIDLLEEATKGDSKNPTYYYHLGMTYEKSGNFARAKKELETALQINPQYSQASEIRKVLTEALQQN